MVVSTAVISTARDSVGKGGPALKGWPSLLTSLLLLLVAGCGGGDGKQDSQPLHSAFSLFRSQPDPVPNQLVAVAQQKGTDWASAQQLKGVSRPIWAVPKARELCLIEPLANGAISRTCTSIKVAVTQGLFTASLADPSLPSKGSRREVVGIVRDGVSAVKVITPQAPVARVPVRSGVFILRDNAKASPGRIVLLD